MVTLKVRELLKPAAKERQGERTDLKPKAANISADRRQSTVTPTEQRKSTADAAKATGASTG